LLLTDIIILTRKEKVALREGGTSVQGLLIERGEELKLKKRGKNLPYSLSACQGWGEGIPRDFANRGTKKKG